MQIRPERDGREPPDLINASVHRGRRWSGDFLFEFAFFFLVPSSLHTHSPPKILPMIYQVTSHGRALPLCWKTTRKSQLKTRRTDIELGLVEAMDGWLPPNTRVVLLADRGFGCQELYDFLGTLGWDYVIRFRQDIYVESEQGERRKASAWVANNGRARMLPRARVTADRTQVPAVVTVKRAGMKEAWCLATSLCDESSSRVVTLYGRRFTIEETFRDTKDLHFGMGLRATHIKGTARRDRMLMLVAIAHTLLTLLGAASEASGLDKYLKANTSKKRTLSLYRQGLYWYACIQDHAGRMARSADGCLRVYFTARKIV